MIKSLLSTSSLNLINVTIISASLLICGAAKADNLDNPFAPSVELSTRNSKKRNIVEIDYMQPFYKNENDISAVDIKLKGDNSKSKEVNVGLVYRHNFNDKVIFGIYGYFDHRRTGNNFAVNGFTPGVELLSKYVDLRVCIERSSD